MTTLAQLADRAADLACAIITARERSSIAVSTEAYHASLALWELLRQERDRLASVSAGPPPWTREDNAVARECAYEAFGRPSISCCPYHEAGGEKARSCGTIVPEEPTAP